MLLVWFQVTAEACIKALGRAGHGATLQAEAEMRGANPAVDGDTPILIGEYPTPEAWYAAVAARQLEDQKQKQQQKQQGASDDDGTRPSSSSLGAQSERNHSHGAEAVRGRRGGPSRWMAAARWRLGLWHASARIALFRAACAMTEWWQRRLLTAPAAR
eukprot:COSAG05_NODE_421_length_9965_cov_60.769207_9_plen_159_part_00